MNSRTYRLPVWRIVKGNCTNETHAVSPSSGFPALDSIISPDACRTDLFACAWFCALCGAEICGECYSDLKVDVTAVCFSFLGSDVVCSNPHLTGHALVAGGALFCKAERTSWAAYTRVLPPCLPFPKGATGRGNKTNV